MSTESIDVGRWYRYTKLDGSKIELKAHSKNSYVERGGTTHDASVMREVNHDLPFEPLESDINWL